MVLKKKTEIETAHQIISNKTIVQSKTYHQMELTINNNNQQS